MSFARPWSSIAQLPRPSGSQLIDQDRSPMNEPFGAAEALVANNPATLPPGDEPDVELPRASDDPPTPLSGLTPLRASITPPWSSPLPSSSGQRGDASNFPSLRSLQATVESAPPSPYMDPVKVDRYEPEQIALGGGEDQESDDHTEGRGDGEQDGPGGVGEPPTLLYVPPNPGQIQRGEPISGWLCEPAWLRRVLGGLGQGDTQGDEQ